MKTTPITTLLLSLIASTACAAGQTTAYDYTKLHREHLGRGLVAVRLPGDSVATSWRFLSTDADDVTFELYANDSLIAESGLNQPTYITHYAPVRADVVYALKEKGSAKVLDRYTLKADAPDGYIEIPLIVPPAGVTPKGDRYTYTANDATIGDVDGDGRYEIILKWEPTNAHDNAHDGYTGNVLIDCYTLDGDQLWRVDLGKNIRAGAHYTQIMVYDLDCDGKAEMVLRTADGTTDAQGNVIGDINADYREPQANQGRILRGKEYLTVFDGLTGTALCTTDYIPQRGDPNSWGDPRANRSDRFLATIAYLDGVRPSVVMCRGYYTRSVLAAFDWDGQQLTTHWVFDTNTPGNEACAGQGNHNLRVADIDGDGCDEIVYGQMCVDHDGTALYSTDMGHGDAMHLTAFIPNDDSLQLWACHENKHDGASFRNPRTGEVYWQTAKPIDVGRCMAADIDPTNPGLEMWSSHPQGRFAHSMPDGVRNYKGEVVISHKSKVSMNSAVWWTGDLNRELLDHNRITKYMPEKGECVVIAEFDGCVANNYTKGNACLSGDIVGDWREEVLMRTVDSSALRLYVTPWPTPYRFHTFLEDVPYRLALAYQNVGYNQPPHVGFYFGSDLDPAKPFRGSNIRLAPE